MRRLDNERFVTLVVAVLAACFWVLDVVVDHVFFSAGTLSDLLTLHVPWHEIAVPSLGFVFFVVAGLIFARFYGRLAHSEQAMQDVNQQLRATEQQLRASNQQLEAGNQQLRAANQQLQATEQQLRASNQQLRAANQQLAAQEQALRAEVEQRRQAEEGLIAERRRLYDVLDVIPAFVCLQDRDNQMHFVNRTFLRLFGEPQGRPCYEVFHGLTVPCEDCKTRAVFATREQYVEEWERENGQTFLVYDNYFHELDSAPLLLRVGVEITKLKQTQEDLAKAMSAAATANRAKSEFLANLSHEIRTPMTAILGYTNLLLEQDLPVTERTTHLNTVRRNAEILLTLINDILDLSKVEAEKLEMEPKACPVWEVVDEALALMQVRAAEKGLTLTAHYRPPLPATVRTDPLRLRQILVNLLGNAIKFTERGGIDVTVRYAPAGERAAELFIDVTDTGIGIAPGEIERLFQPFSQADASTTRRFGGTGLGLTIARSLARRLGGDIDVTSQPEQGSTFTLALDPGPLDHVPLLKEIPDRAPVMLAAKKTAPRLSGRVLLVEDGSDNRRLLGAVLRHADLHVDMVENGLLACEKVLAEAARGQAYNVILMDIQMPVMDGYEATRRLRREGYTCPIIALTAHAMSGDREKCLEAGCTDYVTKPIDRAHLLATIQSHLAGQRPPLSPRADEADERGSATDDAGPP